MILVDNALNKREKENNPIKVGFIGAGEMTKGMINQIVKYTPGMVVAATYNRTAKRAESVYKFVGLNDYKLTESTSELEDAIKNGTPAITSNIDAICEAEGLDILVEVTGTIEFAANFMLKAMDHGKHILTFNAELDATLGAILKDKAKKAGVMYSVGDGDQPGVTLNLYRFVKSMGFEPLVCGNVKGMEDHYRTPATQENFAAQWDMAPEMATNFADGTKVSLEQAAIANALDMRVSKRGMNGFNSKEHVDDLTHLYDIDELKANGGIVDYIIGPKPGPGVFIYATSDDPWSIKYLKYGKLGEGPLYSFYVPYHLLFFEIANSISRMIDFNDTILAAKAGPKVEVVTTAKCDIKEGEVIDGLGGFKSYGICENYDVVRKENLLPIGLAEGCILKKGVSKDQVISFDDIDFDASLTKHKLYKEQVEMYPS
jgi:predicted homoserine dehydrogenase-like protein